MENVLILQGGGSLGAYECGVFKVLAEQNIKFDIVAGTSIGAVNASIISASKYNPAKALEEFWLDIADKFTPEYLPYPFNAFYSLSIASIFGNPKVFKPRWFNPYDDWTYLYDLEPLKDTLMNYIDLDNLRNRLIITATDIQRSESVAFDSNSIRLDMDHILASAAFPFYGIKWINKDNRYFWDGSLLSNTPLREVINASPKESKNVYIVNLFPRVHDTIPTNLFEVWHRARDIMHTDKTKHNIKMSRVISKYLKVMHDMHDLLDHKNPKFAEIEEEYHRIAVDKGAIINKIVRFERMEETHYLFEDADFSISSIKRLI
ncbi:MAG: patatin-like phospholipase family protein, partial [Candidatus Nitrosothermus koennekii]